MIGQHGNQLVLVLGLQQVFHGASRQRGKGGIRRGKDGERAGALQRFDQTGSFNGGNQRGEGACTNGGVDDVLRVAFGESRGRQHGGGGGHCKKGSADHWRHSRLISAMIGMTLIWGLMTSRCG